MNSKRLKTLQVTIGCLILLTFYTGVSQTNTIQIKIEGASLFDEITTMDSLFFSAFNNLEIDTYKAFISKDIEFFHDKNGLINSKNRIVNSLKKISEAKKNSSYTIRRELLKNTLEVHEIASVGALETGIHRFTEISNGNKTITQAQFMHLWKKEKGNWVIAKVFSFDHKPVKEKVNPDEKTISLTKEQMNMYLGAYQFAPEFVLTIVQEGHKLYGVAQGDKIEIKPYDMHKFLIVRDNSKLEFVIDDNNNVIGIEMQTKKGPMKAKKIINQ